jgi:hypothetical protein
VWSETLGGTTYGPASALLRGFYAPGVGRFVVGGEDFVVDVGVDVFGVYEGSVDIEDAGPDWGQMVGHCGSFLSCGHVRRRVHVYALWWSENSNAIGTIVIAFLGPANCFHELRASCVLVHIVVMGCKEPVSES